MDPQSAPSTFIDKPLYDPTYLNIEYIFDKIYNFIKPVIDFFANSHTWITLGFIASALAIIFIAVIIFCLVRMREIQNEEKHELDHEIHLALARDTEASRVENPRWHYILTLIESSNESDWRVAIIEADTMLEEVLRARGFNGDTLSELLEGAKTSGYHSISGVWDAHIIRNQIAHQGSEFPLSQIEGRRVIRLYQNFFEELQVI